METRTMQELADAFNIAYFKACESSMPEDWLNAALAGRHLTNGLIDKKLIIDNLSKLQKQSK